MRILSKCLAVALSLCAGASSAQEGPLIPERRAVIVDNVDFYGGDMVPIFDTNLDTCERTCLADDACQAFTFNARSNACFPKRDVEDQQIYQGAFSGLVYETAAGLADRATARATELAFLRQEDFDAALDQARGLGRKYKPGDLTVDPYLDAARAARAAGNLRDALRNQGMAVLLSDVADQWVEFAELLLDVRTNDSDERRTLDAQALSAALNAYLRAEAAPLRATSLSVMARGLEQVERGRDMIPALRLAQETSPRDDTGAALDDAIGKYGFNITEHEVNSDAARPQICAAFNEDLVRAGQDYAPFVQLPEPGLTVEASGRKLCIEGVTHGNRYAVTFRQGLPAASGEVLQKNVTLNLYVRDRTPSVRFPGRAYILPRTAEAGIPIETVNTDSVDLVLQRISDRNLIRAIQSDYFGRPLSYWEAQNFSGEVAEEIWRGTGDVGMEINRDVTTRLPMDEVTGDLDPGIYALQAVIRGQDPYDKPAATQWFVVSDLGLTTLSGTDGVHVFVRSLGDAKAKAGVKVTLVSRANAVLGDVVTDAEGYAHFPEGLAAGRGESAPALVTVAEGEDDLAFLSLTEPEFDLSDRGVEGREPAPPIDVYLTTERGAYRAGETVHATILARDAGAAALEDLPLTVRLIRPDGVEYARQLAQAAGGGGHVAHLPLAGGVPRGAWRLEALADPDAPALASQTVLVEDFLPERIDFDLALPDGTIRLGDTPELTLTARYLFGAPGAGLAVEGDIRLATAAGLDAFPAYVFGRHDAPFQSVSDSLGSAETDAEGIARIAVAVPDPGEAIDRPLEARMVLRVAEGSGRPVEREITRQILPTAPFIGIKPGFEGGAVGEGDEARFDIIAVGPDGTRAGMEVQWTLNRIETEYQWYSLYGQWNWEPTTSRTRVSEGDLTLTADGAASVAMPVEWGQYELVVERVGGAYAAASIPFDAGWYAAADAGQTPDMLELSLDKAAYRPGETASLRIVPRAAGVALVTVMSNHLIDMRAVAVTEGENLIELSVTDEWGAGAYVTASVLRPMDEAEGRNPSRAIGLAHAAIDPGDRRLVASFEVPDEADPRKALPVALKVEGVAPGETARVTIAAVDVGILNLTGFNSPDPEDHYFGQRKLGMAIRDVYDRLIDGQNGDMGAIRSGGDAGTSVKMQAPPPTEELVAYFSGPLTVGADGYARTAFDLPSFNGTVRLMAVVWSETGIGQASTEVVVRDPVVVTASVPRFMAPGDESRLLLEVVHASGPAGRTGLDVTAEGLTLGPAPSGFDLAEGGKEVITIPLTAAAETGLGEVRIALTTPDGKSLVKDLSVPVQVNDPEIARQSRFDLAAGQNFTFDAEVFAGLIPGTGKATLAVGPIAQFNAPGLLRTLDQYPYGCTEQLTSKALPLLYFEDVARAVGTGQGEAIRERVDEAIAAILTNQSAAGSFGLWHADSGDLWLDAYVSDFLSRARAQGFDVPDTAFRNAMDNLRNQVNYAQDFDSDGGPVAYALMVLAREGAAAVGDLRYYAGVKADAFDTPIAAAQLGAALASYGDQTRADAMFTRAGRLMLAARGQTESQIWRADYGTRLRDAAAVLALSQEAGSEVLPDTLPGTVATGIGAGRVSTQEATWALLATHALIDWPGADGFTADGAPVDGPLVRLLEDRTGGGPIEITNGTAREAVLTLTTFGVPSEPEPAGGKGYAISRSYYTLDGDTMSPDRVAQGDRLVTVLEIEALTDGEGRLIVDDPLPAGFEIDNPNLLRGGDIAALEWLETADDVRMSEFRQERFLAALDWYGTGSFRLAYIVRAVSPGTFRHPAASVEDMYRPDYRARTGVGQVTVTE